MTSAGSKIDAHIADITRSFDRLKIVTPQIVEAGDMLIASLRQGGKILFCGNGGSAADAQHIAAELMGRFLIDRAPLSAISLTTDTSALTAIGNDYGYEQVFSRQLRGLGKPGDVLVAISTSGNSKNVLAALEMAKKIGINTIGLTGGNGGVMVDLCNICICVPAERTDMVQQLHITVGHIMCGLVEEALC
jgi:D-sedoheptulose 7-phosphate isomerase